MPIPTAADLAPAAIAARNAEVVASDLVLKRDIYYTQKPGYRSITAIVWDQNHPAVALRALRLPVGSIAVSEPRQREIIGV